MTSQLWLIAALLMLGLLLAGILLALVEMSQSGWALDAASPVTDALVGIRLLPGWSR